jgi:hypothetical protein
MSGQLPDQDWLADSVLLCSWFFLLKRAYYLVRSSVALGVYALNELAVSFMALRG